MGKSRKTGLRSTRTTMAKREAGMSTTKKRAVLLTTTTAFPEKPTVARQVEPEAASAMMVAAKYREKERAVNNGIHICEVGV